VALTRHGRASWAHAAATGHVPKAYPEFATSVQIRCAPAPKAPAPRPRPRRAQALRLSLNPAVTPLPVTLGRASAAR
jgi:hypothetical protein